MKSTVRESVMKKRLIKTNRIHLIFALDNIIDALPEYGDLNDWCLVAEKAFRKIGNVTYCHKSNQIPLPDHAKKYGELSRFEKAAYHCDMQHDISKLNRDTNDPSGANTDPLFPRNELWVFSNLGGEDLKSVDKKQLRKCYQKYNHIKVDAQYMIASDGHRCLSSPELFIEEFLIDNMVRHAKEGDLDDKGKSISKYPFHKSYNESKRGLQADWVLLEGSEKIFVEYFEGRLTPEYMEKVEKKGKIAKENNIKLIEIWRKDLTPDRLGELLIIK